MTLIQRFDRAQPQGAFTRTVSGWRACDRQQAALVLTFRRIHAPTAAQLQHLFERRSQRIGRYRLERQGLLMRDPENDYLQLGLDTVNMPFWDQTFDRGEECPEPVRLPHQGGISTAEWWVDYPHGIAPVDSCRS